MSIRETANYVETAKLLEWLHNQFGETRVVEMLYEADDHRWTRRYFAWRHEQKWSSVYTVDSLLVHVFGYNLQDVPEECFCVRKFAKLSSEQRTARRETAVKELRRGAEITDLAERFDVSLETLKKWRRQYVVKAA